MNSVENYLTSRSSGGERLQTNSYGAERPQHDNTREETRHLNRLAALVVRVQQSTHHADDVYQRHETLTYVVCGNRLVPLHHDPMPSRMLSQLLVP